MHGCCDSVGGTAIYLTW